MIRERELERVAGGVRPGGIIDVLDVRLESDRRRLQFGQHRADGPCRSRQRRVRERAVSARDQRRTGDAVARSARPRLRFSRGDRPARRFEFAVRARIHQTRPK